MDLPQRIDHVWVVPMARPFADVFDGLDWGHQRWPVKTGTRDGVKGISDRQDSRPERNDFALESSWISTAIPSLMMVTDDGSHFCKSGVLRDHVCSDVGVTPHDLPLRFT